MVDQARAWRLALSGILRVSAGSRGADRARNPLADRAPHHPPASFCIAAPFRFASGLAVTAGVVPLRPYRRPQPAADDARLVVLTARDAADRGAEIRTRSRAVEIRQVDGIWRVTVENTGSGERNTIQARVLINAGGPWVEDVLASGAGVNARAKVRLVQGSHIVVRKLYAHDRAYMFQNSDGRIVFVIPYQDDFTLIGTTDRDFDGDPAKVKASTEEIKYLCDSVSEYLAKPVKPEDVVWTYAGVRPLYDDGASEAKAATRDYVFELDTPGGAPLLSIYGGKITTYRRLAEEALERLSPYLRSAKAREGWTAKSP